MHRLSAKRKDKESFKIKQQTKRNWEHELKNFFSWKSSRIWVCRRKPQNQWLRDSVTNWRDCLSVEHTANVVIAANGRQNGSSLEVVGRQCLSRLLTTAATCLDLTLKATAKCPSAFQMSNEKGKETHVNHWLCRSSVKMKQPPRASNVD